MSNLWESGMSSAVRISYYIKCRQAIYMYMPEGGYMYVRIHVLPLHSLIGVAKPHPQFTQPNLKTSSSGPRTGVRSRCRRPYKSLNDAWAQNRRQWS